MSKRGAEPLKHTDQPMERFALLIPEALLDAMREQARKENRNLSNMVRHACAQYVERVRQAEALIARENGSHGV